MLKYRYFGIFRFVLALLVMAQHYIANFSPAYFKETLGWVPMGSVAVLVFFVMSGFIIVEAVDQIYSRRPVDFLINRLLRIVPHFVIAAILAILVHLAFLNGYGFRLWEAPLPSASEVLSFKNLAANLFLLLPGADRFSAYQFLEIVWAVRVELAFYMAVFGSIIIKKYLHSKVPISFILLLTCVAITPLFLLSLHGKVPAMLGFLPFFVFGGALFYCVEGSRRALLILASAAFGIFLYLIQDVNYLRLIQTVGPGRHDIYLFVVLLATFIVLCRADFSALRVFDKKTGEVTYPLYLYHEVTLMIMLMATPSNSYASLILGIGVSIAFSILMMAIVDQRVGQLRDRVRRFALS